MARSLKNDPAAIAAAMASLATSPLPARPSRPQATDIPPPDLQSASVRKRLARQATKITGLKQVTSYTPITAGQKGLTTKKSRQENKRRRRRRP